MIQIIFSWQLKEFGNRNSWTLLLNIVAEDLPILNSWMHLI